MKRIRTCLAIAIALPLSSLSAEQAQPPLPKGQTPDLGRPTTKDDPVPVFDFEAYFTGKWNFEWVIPDSPLGPGGVITGNEVFQPGVEGRFFESSLEGTGPNGSFTVSSRMVYDPEYKFLARQQKDSRGFETLEGGHIGGDLGGYYTIYYESAPFEYDGKSIRLKMTTILYSPLNFKVRARISVDGGPFVNFGNPWWRKEVEGLTSNAER